MEAVKYTNFKLTSTIARGIARQRGEVQQSYKTNRKGAYYFSCSGHGGFIIDSQALSKEENERAKEIWINAFELRIVVGKSVVDWQDYVLYISYRDSTKKKLFFSGEYVDLRFESYPYYEWEEDCAWALYNFVFGISYEYKSTDGTTKTPDAHSKDTVKNYFWEIYEKVTGETIKDWESYSKDEKNWNEKTKESYIVTSAIRWQTFAGINDIEVSEDEIFCEAKKYVEIDGEQLIDKRYYIIPSDVYNTRGTRSYVIWSNPDKEILIPIKK